MFRDNAAYSDKRVSRLSDASRCAYRAPDCILIDGRIEISEPRRSSASLSAVARARSTSSVCFRLKVVLSAGAYNGDHNTNVERW